MLSQNKEPEGGGDVGRGEAETDSKGRFCLAGASLGLYLLGTKGRRLSIKGTGALQNKQCHCEEVRQMP